MSEGLSPVGTVAVTLALVDIQGTGGLWWRGLRLDTNSGKRAAVRVPRLGLAVSRRRELTINN